MEEKPRCDICEEPIDFELEAKYEELLSEPCSCSLIKKLEKLG